MPEYIDGFVIAVPKKKMADYIKTAKVASKVWRDHGAIDYRECMLDDAKVKFGNPFAKLINKKPGETIVFAYIVYKSKKQRDKVFAKVMADPRMNEGLANIPCPFDMSRMFYSGFDSVVK